MPLIRISTSEEIKDKKEFISKSAEFISELTNKPIKFVMVILEDNLDMYFLESESYCCYVDIKSIGSLRPSDMAKKVSDFISREIQIPSNKIYINFEDVSPTNWAWNGKTFR